MIPTVKDLEVLFPKPTCQSYRATPVRPSPLAKSSTGIPWAMMAHVPRLTNVTVAFVMFPAEGSQAGSTVTAVIS